MRKNVLPNTWLQSSYLSVLENTDTGVGGAEVNADSGLLGHLARVDLFAEKDNKTKDYKELSRLGCVGWSEWRDAGSGLSTPGGTS